MAKTKLSKHLLEMKFMQRTAVRLQTEESQEEQQRQIDDEHWVLDLPTLEVAESKYVFEPSFVHCQELSFGRFSFKGFNPDIEKLNQTITTEEQLARSEAKEKETMVDDEEMAERYQSLVGTIGNKFKKKKDKVKEDVEEEMDEEDDIEMRTYRLLNQLREIKEQKIFLKPMDA